MFHLFALNALDQFLFILMLGILPIPFFVCRKPKPEPIGYYHRLPRIVPLLSDGRPRRASLPDNRPSLRLL